MRQYKFFLHYNKPASLKAGKPKITIHHRGKCHILDNVIINVPACGEIRKTQPRFVIAGMCNQFDIVDNVGILA